MFGAFYFGQAYFADAPTVAVAPPAPTPTPSTASPTYGLGGRTGVVTLQPHYTPDFGSTGRRGDNRRPRRQWPVKGDLVIAHSGFAAGSVEPNTDIEDLLALASSAISQLNPDEP